MTPGVDGFGPRHGFEQHRGPKSGPVPDAAGGRIGNRLSGWLLTNPFQEGPTVLLVVGVAAGVVGGGGCSG
ncbi:hypothetical protein, partial [Arthrobacter sp. 18067]|uniref:hypothetical protein n=1 Tax=Arthrobacter sp. 18067 TaxID=2681413 RepID=UPI001F279121